MLLHLCTIVEASPFFTDLMSSIHLDSVGPAQPCEGMSTPEQLAVPDKPLLVIC
jgi:hypothetical protein